MLMNQIQGDEGMWTFHNLPLEKLKKDYNFVPTKKFLDNLIAASVRFNDGGSGSFISDSGLVITNHHVAMSQLQKLSTSKNDYVKKGFFAKSKSEEIKCTDLEINILVNFENVSEKIFSEIKFISDNKLRLKKLKEISSKIEKDSFEKTGFRSDVVEFFDGGEYYLYRYKKYTDIRLVMTPEISLAAFGGDADNFNFPRYVFDFAFFRVYENNKPIKSQNFLPFAKKSVVEDELVFVSGHPGSTDRQKTFSQIKFDFDYIFPNYIRNLEYKLKMYREFSKLSKENERIAKDSILGMENGLKSITGEYHNLKDKELLDNLQKKESEFRKQIKEKDKSNTSFESIENAQNRLIQRFKEYFYRSIGSSKLLNIALKIIRYRQEILKPNEERYEEFRDSNLDSLKLKLFSKAPIYKDLEKLSFKTTLEISSEHLEKEDAFRNKAIGTNQIDELLEEIIDKTNLDNPEFRKQLLELKQEDFSRVNDPLIKYVLELEPILRQERDFYEEQIESVFTKEGKVLSDKRFEIYKNEIYPDATFTLRLSIGKVKGYEDTNSILVPYKTTFYGLFERNSSFHNKDEFELPIGFLKQSKSMDLETSVNFISTNDIIGGNSGSPILNKKGEFVGIIFDGNFHSHIWNYVYSDLRGRAISVDVNAIRGLLKFYKFNSLLRELDK